MNREELRRLAEAATPGPWESYDRGIGWEVWADGAPLNSAFRDTFPAYDAAYIAATDPAAVLDLLDRLDAAEARLAAVRALHYAADNDVRRTPVCETCHGEAGVHECGCWSPEDRQPVCGHCNEGHKCMSVAWPCPTIRALDADPTTDGGQR